MIKTSIIHNKNTQKFLRDAFETLKKNNIRTRIRKTSYYDFVNKELGIFSPQTTTKTIWLKYFVHEYCHALQQIENSRCYRKMVKYDIKISKMNLNDKKAATKKLDFVRELEIECEKMTIKMIKKYNLPIDIKKTIKEVNAYICYYHGVQKTKKWKTKKCIYNKEVLNKMPTTIRNYSKYIPQDKLNAILSCF